MRAGSTTFFDAICRHPRITPPFLKEVHYFDLNAHRSLDWYRAHFPKEDGKTITGEATPSYLFLPHVAPLAADLLPRARLLIILRDPVARAISHYVHECRSGRETRPFRQAIVEDMQNRPMGLLDRMRTSYVQRGLYSQQIERWEKHFDPSTIKVVLLDDLVRETTRVLEETYAFLSLPTTEVDIPPLSERNQQQYAIQMPDSLANEVRAYLEPDNSRLAKWLGTTPPWLT